MRSPGRAGEGKMARRVIVVIGRSDTLRLPWNGAESKGLGLNGEAELALPMIWSARRAGLQIGFAGFSNVVRSCRIARAREGEQLMTAENPPLPKKTWTAIELRKLPADERDAILEAAAVLAAKIYRNNPELTDFEAFGEVDLYGESTAVPEG